MTRNRRVGGRILSSLQCQMVMLTVFLPPVLPIAAEAFDFQDCVGCHDASLENDSEREYLHSPFEQKQCGHCHALEDPEEFTAAELKAQQKINWLGEAKTPFTDHSFLLSADKLSEVLVVDLKEKEGIFSRREIAVPLLDDLAEVEDSGKAPAISAVQVLQVRQGVLLTATIGWQTDTFADALVRYGEQELSQSSGPGKRFGREHRVLLQNLKANRTYRFSVTSRDLFGRTQVSDPITFSTAGPEVVTASVDSHNGQEGKGNVGFSYDFKRLGNDYLLELSFDQPTQTYVGSKGKNRAKDLPGDEFHAGLGGKASMSLKACLNCHKAHLHPLNVAPTKPGISIPPELPTLPGGRVTCTSCHDPHGSDFYFYLRKPDKQELCISCHQK